MDPRATSAFNSKASLSCLCVLRTQEWPRLAMAAALWRAGLLLGFLRVGACLDGDCVIAVSGQPASLPCLYPDLSTLKNVSVEWRRGDEVVLRWVWKADGSVEKWSVNSATVSADALLTGNVSLELRAVDAKEDNTDYSVLVASGESDGARLLCTVCLRTAASFSSPLLQREEDRGEETAYICHSSGGFPEPEVYWIINDNEEPPEGSVRTLAAPHPDSHLYNITSHLTVSSYNISSVSCIIENQFMNETLTSTSYGVRGSKVAKRASEAMWIFSMALCVVVGAMVIGAVVYQVHLDRMSKKKKKVYENASRGYKRQFPNEVEDEVMKIETDV